MAMKIAILGYDTEGKVSYDYFKAQGHEVIICDQNPDLQVPQGATAVLGPSYLTNLDRFDVLVRTAGMQPRKILEANPGVEAKITTQTNEFFKVSPTKNIIGVTGTKGKGTTSTLIAKMLEADNKQVCLGGNIGVAPLSFLATLTPESWVVLELSSFQLIDLRYSPHIGVCLMVTPEHLDWHPDTDEYFMAKTQMFRYQTPDDFAIYNVEDENSERIASTGKAWKLPYMSRPGAYVQDEQIFIDDQSVCKTSELKLLGKHNWQNVCAAITAFWKVSQNLKAIQQVVTSFSGLPFRIEFRGEKRGIRFYNDSFASQPNATIAAIDAIPGTKIMIIGGHERGLDLTDLAQKIKDSEKDIRKVLAIGATGKRVTGNLQAAGFTAYELSEAKTMPEVVQQAIALAQPGDAVILSPGFASYDMFKNFEDRGQQFNAAVEAL